ncbi:hypothetical protein KM043_015890 [Ampulex compressa]|nr:hypothetical protein KM043_015890 [Ampulex compressa]
MVVEDGLGGAMEDVGPGGGRGWRGSNARKGRAPWNKRKVCGAHDVSVVEVACLPRPLLAPHPASESCTGLKARGYCLPLCANAVSFIYLSLSLPAAGGSVLSLRPSLASFHYSGRRTVYVNAERNGSTL